MANRYSIKNTLFSHNLAPSKRFGQNFLVHQETAAAIARAACLKRDACVVEIGVGLGALTLQLAALVDHVIGIEIDRGIISYHERERILPDNVTLIHGDILRFDLAGLAKSHGSQLEIVANLPYAITNPFLFRMIEFRDSIDHITVMLQKEVAERLTAAPGTKAYGIPSVLFGCCADIEALMTLGPEQFHPRPKIESQVVRITFLHQDSSMRVSFARLREIVRAAFASRRKTLLNNLLVANLAPFTNEDSGSSALQDAQQLKMALSSAITAVGLPLNVRGETLTTEQFVALAAALVDQFHHTGKTV